MLPTDVVELASLGELGKKCNSSESSICERKTEAEARTRGFARDSSDPIVLWTTIIQKLQTRSMLAL